MDLRMPESGWIDQEKHWSRLTGSLCSYLQEAQAQGVRPDFRDLEQALDSWEPFLESCNCEREVERQQWLLARRLLWCAEHAPSIPSPNWDSGDRLRRVAAEVPDCIRGHEAWALDCMRLLRKSNATEQSIQVAVALSDELLQATGCVATLVLDLLKPGSGQVFQRPDDALCTHTHADFIDSMRVAWAAARELARKQGVNVSFDGRWRLLKDGQAVPRISGRSAGGAAMLGWYHAFARTVVDPNLLVLAQVSGSDRPAVSEATNGRDYKLGGVGGIAAKVKAAAVDGRFDTIVVASDENHIEAQTVLRHCAKPGLVRVVNLCGAAAEKLITVRSSLEGEVADYLDALARHAAELPRYYPTRLVRHPAGETPFDAIRQVVQFIEDRAAFARWRAEEEERMRAAGMDWDRLAYTPIRAQLDSVKEDARQESRPLPTTPVVWDENAAERFPRAVILGDPGFGKTWLLRYEARRLARQTVEGLRQQEIHLNELVLPILVRLSDLNQSDDTIEDALVSIVREQRSQAFGEFVRAQLETGRAVVLLDAWDEVPTEVPEPGQPIAYLPRYRQRLGLRLDKFTRRFPRLRMLLTSRIVGYTGSPIPGAKELELLAFDWPEIESYVRVWFSQETDTGDRFLVGFQHNHQVRGLARIPLMLTLMCRAYQENRLELPTRRVDLYDLCVCGLLRDWNIEDKKREGLDTSPAHVEAVVELLESVALSLLSEGYEQFTESHCRMIMVEWLNTLKSTHELHGRSAGSIIADVKRDGILIKAGEYHDAPLLFLHRTFQEHLAARALARQANASGWGAIGGFVDKKAWDPSWHETIVLLAGRLIHPIPLLHLLANAERDDLFRHRLALACRCLPEISEGIRKRIALAHEITKTAIGLWLTHNRENTEPVVRHLTAVFPALAQTNGFIDRRPLLDWVSERIHACLQPSGNTPLNRARHAVSGDRRLIVSFAIPAIVQS